MKKYGGEQRLKQCCVERRCKNRSNMNAPQHRSNKITLNKRKDKNIFSYKKVGRLDKKDNITFKNAMGPKTKERKSKTKHCYDYIINNQPVLKMKRCDDNLQIQSIGLNGSNKNQQITIKQEKEFKTLYYIHHKIIIRTKWHVFYISHMKILIIT